MKSYAPTLVFTLCLLLSACVTTPEPDTSASGYATRSPEAYKIQQDSLAAMNDLYKKSADARWCGQQAQAVLVFPNVTKGGFVVGAQVGRGALFMRDQSGANSYYNTVSTSYGLQAGVQQFGYALFIMDDNALQQLKRAKGWEIGTSPNLTVIDIGAAATNISNITTTRGVYAFFFNQRGLMAGLSLEGSKISRIHP